MAEPETRRSVEELAQTLYEASDPNGPPWAQRGRVVREPWLQVARDRIAQFKNRAARNGEAGPDGKVEP